MLRKVHRQGRVVFRPHRNQQNREAYLWTGIRPPGTFVAGDEDTLASLGAIDDKASHVKHTFPLILHTGRYELSARVPPFIVFTLRKVDDRVGELEGKDKV